MTWTWAIAGLGTTEQTLTVYNPDGDSVGSQTAESWTWSGDYPGTVPDLMPSTLDAFMAIQQDNIERRSE